MMQILLRMSKTLTMKRNIRKMVCKEEIFVAHSSINTTTVRIVLVLLCFVFFVVLGGGGR